MSLKFRLNLIITLLLVAVMAVGMMLMVRNAREDVRAEVDSTVRLAHRMLDAQVLHLSTYSMVVWDTSPFHLRDLSNLRHLRIEFRNNAGRIVDSNRPQQPANVAGDAVPQWFSGLLALGDVRAAETRRPIIFQGQQLGVLVVTPDASWEIAEVWNDTAGILGLILGFFIVINGMVYIVVSRALRPVERIRHALMCLGQGKMEERLPHFSQPEMSDIATHFNEMARHLQQGREDNRRLTHQLIELQERERKSMARNLHDELGQSLTTIQIETSAILGARRLTSVRNSAAVIQDMVRGIHAMVRGMLRDLRPGALDEFGLRAALLDLVETWRGRNPGVEVAMDIAEMPESVPEVVAVSAYRFMQECLTNIARHALATHVTLTVAVVRGRLRLHVEDNGRGFDPGARATGFGLTGMRERVAGLGGTLDLRSAPGQGTRISAVFPCNGASAA